MISLINEKPKQIDKNINKIDETNKMLNKILKIINNYKK